MENLDIIILSTIITTLFAVFGIYTITEFKKIGRGNEKVEGFEMGPRANLIRFIGALFDESQHRKLTPKQQAVVYSSVKRTIADMESDGVYFPKEIVEDLKKKRDQLICNYSDLPSVMSYLDEEEFYSGHS